MIKWLRDNIKQEVLPFVWEGAPQEEGGPGEEGQGAVQGGEEGDGMAQMQHEGGWCLLTLISRGRGWGARGGSKYIHPPGQAQCPPESTSPHPDVATPCAPTRQPDKLTSMRMGTFVHIVSTVDGVTVPQVMFSFLA